MRYGSCSIHYKNYTQSNYLDGLHILNYKNVGIYTIKLIRIQNKTELFYILLTYISV